jgi:hypothetical protein
MRRMRATGGAVGIIYAILFEAAAAVIVLALVFL